MVSRLSHRRRARQFSVFLGFPWVVLVFSEFWGQGLGCFWSDWTGHVGSCVFFVLPTPRSYWAGWFGCLVVVVVVVVVVFPSCRPTHSVLVHGLGNRAAKLRHGNVVFFVFVSFFVLSGAARVIWLVILWHRTVCVFSYFLCDACYFVFSFYAFSARHFPPSRDCGLCHLSISCWFSPFRLATRHDGGLRDGFDVGFSCQSACVLLQFAFLRLAPPPPRWRFAGGF